MENKKYEIMIERELPFHIERRSWVENNGEQHWHVPFLVWEDGTEEQLDDDEGIDEVVFDSEVQNIYAEVIAEIAEILKLNEKEVWKKETRDNMDNTEVTHDNDNDYFYYYFYFELTNDEIKKLEKNNYEFDIE